MTREEEALKKHWAWSSVEEIKKAEELYLSGMSTLDVANELDKNQATVWTLVNYLGISRKKHYATEADILLAKELRMRGCSWQEVADAVGFSTRAVRGWFKNNKTLEVVG